MLWEPLAYVWTTSRIVRLVIILTGILVYVGPALLRWRDRKTGGFDNYIQDPDGYDTVSKQAREAAEKAYSAAEQWTSEELAAEVMRFVLSENERWEASQERRVLTKLGVRSQAVALALLADISLSVRWESQCGAPFERVCLLLGDEPPAAVIPLVAPFLDSSIEETRLEAAFLLGKTGHLKAAPLLAQVLAGPEPRICSYVLMGLGYAKDRLDPELSTTLFPVVAGLLKRGIEAAEAAELLVSFDRSRSVEWFLSPEVLNLDFPSLAEVIAGLLVAKAAVPPDQLRRLISSFEPDLEYPADTALGNLLRLLGRQANSQDEELLLNFMRRPEEEVAAGAAEGAIALAGLEEMRRCLEKGQWQEMNFHQRCYHAVYWANALIISDGLAGYLAGESGDRWRDAAVGLEAMGAGQTLGILRQAMDLFGTAGPSSERAIRRRQLIKVDRNHRALLKELSLRWYKSPEIPEVFLARFILAHRESFPSPQLVG